MDLWELSDFQNLSKLSIIKHFPGELLRCAAVSNQVNWQDETYPPLFFLDCLYSLIHVLLISMYTILYKWGLFFFNVNNSFFRLTYFFEVHCCKCINLKCLVWWILTHIYIQLCWHHSELSPCAPFLRQLLLLFLSP